MVQAGQAFKSGLKLSHNARSALKRWGKTEDSGYRTGFRMRKGKAEKAQFFLLSPHDIILRGWQDFTVQATSSAPDTSGVLGFSPVGYCLPGDRRAPRLSLGSVLKMVSSGRCLDLWNFRLISDKSGFSQPLLRVAPRK